jgi:hypothetical protein
MPRLTKQDRLEILEQLLHTIQLHADVTMNHNAVRELIGRICTWSRAHRVGNSSLSERSQHQLIQKALLALNQPLEITQP